ncbi:MAG: DUF3127 domain-containing protein [Bacteroidetes bacterium]|nr:DUF3127 domain-containing protein [Bacteroidota bacterium]
MDIKGQLIEIFDAQKVSDTFKKREFVVEYAENPQYPELLKFELIQEKCDLLDDYKKGEDIEVFFNLKGRKWTDPQGVDKYFTSLQAWRLAPANPEPATEGGAPPPTAGDDPGWSTNSNAEEGDELPF